MFHTLVVPILGRRGGSFYLGPDRRIKALLCGLCSLEGDLLSEKEAKGARERVKQRERLREVENHELERRWIWRSD